MLVQQCSTSINKHDCQRRPYSTMEVHEQNTGLLVKLWGNQLLAKPHGGCCRMTAFVLAYVHVEMAHSKCGELEVLLSCPEKLWSL